MKGKSLAVISVVLTILIVTLGISPAFSATGVCPVSDFAIEPASTIWSTANASLGDPFSFDVIAHDLVDFSSWSGGIKYDPSVLNYTGYDWGNMSSYVDLHWLVPRIEGEINLTTGETTKAWSEVADTGEKIATLGALKLITFHFEVVGYGTTTLEQYPAPLCVAGNFEGEVYYGVTDFPLVNGTFSFTQAPVHDIAVTSVVPSTLEVIVGDSVDIDVVVENEGNVEDSFTLNVYAGVDLIGTENATLAAGATETYNFTWTTTDEGNFLIKAEVPAVSGEVDTADNVLEDGTVLVSPVTVHDVAVTDIRTSSYEVDINTQLTVTISVDVANEGDFPETFNVTVRYDTTDIDTETVTDLPAGNSTTVDFEWTITGVPLNTPYTIEAEAILAGDNNPTNNKMTSDWTIKIVPEFPTPMSLILMLAILAVSAIILKRRTRKHLLTQT